MAKKESAERYRKRWEGLCASRSGAGGKKLALGEVPSVVDRIPNPFGRYDPDFFKSLFHFITLTVSSLGFDYSSWSWLTEGNNGEIVPFPAKSSAVRFLLITLFLHKSPLRRIFSMAHRTL
jgi:hypothetical protein